MAKGGAGEDGERFEVVGQLFYLITAVAEDAASDAASCQSAQMSASERKSAAAKLRSSGEMIEIIASAIELGLTKNEIYVSRCAARRTD